MATSDNRPLIEKQAYQLTPGYKLHGADDDRLAILVCRIKVWKAKEIKTENNKIIHKWFDVPTSENECMIIREAESIEISSSYKELVSKAVINFPRGTLIEKVKGCNVYTDSGNDNGTISVQSIDKATQNGDLITQYTQKTDIKSDSDVTLKSMKHTIQTIPMDGTAVDAGLTSANSHLKEKDLLTVNDFRIGNRIEIYLGYAYSQEEFEKMNSDTNKVPVNMELAFTGFITKCSASTPLQVECENMAHVLTTVNVPDIKLKKQTKLRDFLADDGQFHLLKDSGISVGEYAENQSIEVANVHIGSQLSVADVLKEWQKAGIMSYIEDNPGGESVLRVGRIYYAGLGGNSMPTKDKQYITYNKAESYNIIQFDWDVANDNLSLMNTDKTYLAVAATGRASVTEDKWIKFTLRRNSPNSDDFQVSENDQDWSIVNEKTYERKKARKRVNGSLGKQPQGYTLRSHPENRSGLENYTVIPYISQSIPCSREKLIEEAKQYWTSYVPNGISGTLSIFGDLQIKPSDIVGLIDPRNPLKNGYYLVESVDIKFGTDGFRKELKLPYKIAKFKDIPVYYTRA